MAADGFPGRYDGRTYYGRPSLKPAPFNAWAVGCYILLAAMSGSSAIIATVADLGAGVGGREVARRGRFLSLLAPVIGAPLLIWDLHTPQRFYNMLRIARATSPMSIGTWILSAFSGAAFLTAAAEIVRDRDGWAWARRVPALLQIPTALAGAGLCTYTAALLSATSTPLWAAAPRAIGVRMSASAVASGAAALRLTARSGSKDAAWLDRLMVAAAAIELGGAAVMERSCARRGVTAMHDADMARLGGSGLGAMTPIALTLAASAVRKPTTPVGAAVMLTGCLLLRVGLLRAGAESARRPGDNFRLTERA